MSAQPSEIAAPVELIPEAPGFVVSIVRRLRGDPLGLLGLLIVLTVIVLAIIGPSIAPYSPFKIKVPERFMPPTLLALVGGGDGIHGTFSHVFGTDNLGRDVLLRIVNGTSIDLQIGLFTVLPALTIGSLLGALAGYYGSIVDMAVMRLVDIVVAFPFFVLVNLVTDLIYVLLDPRLRAEIR